MNKWLKSLKEDLVLLADMYRDTNRLVLPEDFTPEQMANFYEVVDNQADTTLFSFAGLALPFGGLPIFEFRKSLGTVGSRVNLVFLRDIRGLWYHLTPQGSPGGLAFYAEQVLQLQKQLGASHHITLGASAGGFAALYIGQITGAESILAYGPQVKLSDFARPDVGRHLFNPRLWHQPEEYLRLELGLSKALYNRFSILKEKLGSNPIGTVEQAFQHNPNPQTQVYVYYCQHHRLDCQQVKALMPLTGVNLRPCDCNLHGVAVYLRSRNALIASLKREVEILRT
ncbi:MAG: hypothetical protein KME08_13305 [Aphanothece sp. CMT-3BRIN-NPC111]|jgi:hypothetical protein|nr:hypothetical protein [Aphanothece sp. CMT-3BRIN-NPC111]